MNQPALRTSLDRGREALIYKYSSDNLRFVARGAAKAALFDSLASVALALGSGRRAEIVDVLAQGERSVEELAGEISQSLANTSQHLQVLARAGLLSPGANCPDARQALRGTAQLRRRRQSAARSIV